MVQFGHRLAEGREAGSAASRELCQICAGDLAMPGDSLHGHIGSVVIVRPRCTTGRPVRSLVTTLSPYPEPSPRRISMATGWLRV
jgi:hypothetical protein